MWLFRKKADQGEPEPQHTAKEDENTAEGSEEMDTPKGVVDEKTPKSPGSSKSKNRRKPRKNSKAGAKAEHEGNSEVAKDDSKHDVARAASSDSTQCAPVNESGAGEDIAPDSAPSISDATGNGAVVADLESRLKELTDKHAEVQEQLMAATAAKEGLEKVLEVTSQQLDASQKTIESMKEQEAQIQSADRELCTAMKERMYHLARKIGEQSYDWKICCASLERVSQQQEAAATVSDKVQRLAQTLGVESSDPTVCFAAVEEASRSHAQCSAMQQRFSALALQLGSETRGGSWEDSAGALASFVAESSDSRAQIAALHAQILGAAAVLGVESQDVPTFFAYVPTLKAERDIWTSARARMVAIASSRGVDSTDWGRCLAEIERATGDSAELSQLRGRLLRAATEVGREAGDADAALAVLETTASEWREIREQQEAMKSERALFKEAMDGVYALARALGEESGDWRQCLKALEGSLSLQGEHAEMRERLASVAKMAGETSGEWRACVAAVEREMEDKATLGMVHSLMLERLLQLARSLGEASDDWKQCFVSVEQQCERAMEHTKVGTATDGGEGLATVVVKELHLLLLSMQAQGWEFSGFFKTAVPEELKRSEVYELLHALMTEFQDRIRMATQHRLYHFSTLHGAAAELSASSITSADAHGLTLLRGRSDDEDLGETSLSSEWHSPPVDTAAPLFPLHEDPAAMYAAPLEHAPPSSLYESTAGGPTSALYQSMASVPLHAQQADPQPVAALYQSTAGFAGLGAASSMAPAPSIGAAGAAQLELMTRGLSPSVAQESSPLPSSPPHRAPLSAPSWLGEPAQVASHGSERAVRRGSLEQFVSNLMEPTRPLTFYYGASEEGSVPSDRHAHVMRHHRPADPAQPPPLDDARRELQYGSLDWHPLAAQAAGGPEEGREGREGRVRFRSPAHTPPTSAGSMEWSAAGVLAHADSAQLQAAMWQELGLRLKAGGEGGAVRVMEKALGAVGFAVRDVRAGDTLVGVNGWACSGQDVDAVSRVILSRRVEGLVLGLRGRKGGTYQVSVAAQMSRSEA